jgi:L-aspartate oxidase
MGGIVCDLHGRTTLPGLYAVGECSCTGVHGANRLASNSLTECFVFGARAAAAAAGEPAPSGPPTAEARWRFEPPTAATREAVWRLAGPQRTAGSLDRLLADPYPLARLVAQAALARRESRGPHRRSDFPLRDDSLDGVHVVIAADETPRHERWK